MTSAIYAKAAFRARSIRWGFIWALWCAVLWGAWYVPGAAIWQEQPFAAIDMNDTRQFLTAAAVITTFNACAVLLFLFLWLVVLDKFGDFVRTATRVRKISKWYFAAAIFGGPMAIFGSFLAMGYVGAVFAAISGLLYPIVGATIARAWYKERITMRAALGILVIVGGGIAIYAPGILGELSNASTNKVSWLGYLGGAMAAFGWGIEGAVAGRALDVTDPDCGITVRFTAEVFYWACLVLPALALFGDVDVIQLILATLNLKALTWLLLAGITFGFCYVSWYKSFPLIGVGRGQAIAALYGAFAVVFLAVFTLQFPAWNFLVGLALVVGGAFMMYTEKSDVLEVVRAL
ncbi:MAG TPA: DMT family transporter [Aromatoleum sp.]|uniref:DMT family transporter n=1 Tax=Aromatoleum sp. TaxID=2307007 RepID=UPI002B48E1BB|nr:DMT family transporter [Aromatoleum sp.]HJV24449.1 DMT family transporter [Aromatoleum sp.]